MGTICNNTGGECCDSDYFFKSSNSSEIDFRENTNNLNNKNGNNLNSKEISINSNKKLQIVVIIVAGKSLSLNEVLIKDHYEYEVSRFYVIEQMKITAKELKPKAIIQAICNSNKSYSFVHNGFCVFYKGDTSLLYKKMRIIDIESNEILLPGNLYYLFADNYNEFVSDSKATNSQGILTNPKFKKLNFTWKKQRDESKSKSNSTNNDLTTSSENSDVSGLFNSKKIDISPINDRRTRYSIINSMCTIKEVDSIHNTSAFNVTINTNNIGSAPITNNNSILNTQNTMNI